jgi:hypothetical protein
LNVHTFDISVQLLVSVEIVETAEKFPQNDRDILLMDDARPQ